MILLYNTLTRKKEVLKPIVNKKINMYVCGPTVQGPGHIGHARTYIAFDIIRRYLEQRGFKVKFVMNITDIHDDVITKANELRVSFKQLTQKYIKLFFKDMQSLFVKKAAIYPKVSDHIKEIILMVKTLQEKSYAYETQDGVYFDIRKFKEYGKLSGVKPKKGKTGLRVKTDKYEKEAVQDFALWKKAKPKEPFWQSPWGKGRPGWHIECSAMSTLYLGKQFDIHAGAVDLIFPHHENEIAQSEASTGKKPFVKYWLHSGLLDVEGQKMSKSLGNYIEIQQLLKKHRGKAFRFFIAALHYKSRVDFSQKAIEKAEKTLAAWNQLIQRLQETSNGRENNEIKKLIKETREKFVAAMDDDFNAPTAWAKLQQFKTKINKLINQKEINKKASAEIIKFLREIDAVFQVFSFEKEKATLSKEDLLLIKEREKLRREKKWKEADAIRAGLRKKGILLDDTEKGPK